MSVSTIPRSLPVNWRRMGPTRWHSSIATAVCGMKSRRLSKICRKRLRTTKEHARNRSQGTVPFAYSGDNKGKMERVRFAGTARRVLRTNRPVPFSPFRAPRPVNAYEQGRPRIGAVWDMVNQTAFDRTGTASMSPFHRKPPPAVNQKKTPVPFFGSSRGR